MRLHGFLMLAVLVTCGCATRESVHENKVDGTGKWYPIDPPRAKEIAKAILAAEGAEEFEESANYVGADLGWSFGTVGTLTGVWFDARDDGSTGVTILTRRKLGISFATGLRESTFHERFERGVAMAHAGQPIPAELE
jgi:hypothetical protein